MHCVVIVALDPAVVIVSTLSSYGRGMRCGHWFSGFPLLLYFFLFVAIFVFSLCVTCFLLDVILFSLWCSVGFSLVFYSFLFVPRSLTMFFPLLFLWFSIAFPVVSILFSVCFYCSLCFLSFPPCLPNGSSLVFLLFSVCLAIGFSLFFFCFLCVFLSIIFGFLIVFSMWFYCSLLVF